MSQHRAVAKLRLSKQAPADESPRLHRLDAVLDLGLTPGVAEYKQVTVLFADVVHSIDIAKAVSAERLREIMAGLRLSWRRREDRVNNVGRQASANAFKTGP